MPTPTLWQSIKNLFVHPATPLYYGRIPDAQVPGFPAGEAVQEGEAYVRLWLTQMYLIHDRTWFQDWYPVAHTLVQLRFADQQISVPYIAGPGIFKDLDEQHLGHVIQLNRQLTGLLPYNGGSFEVQAGLLAMKGNNQLSAALKVVSDISSLLAVPQLSSVLTIAAPLANGVQGLLASAASGLQIGLEQTFSSGTGGANTLRAGYFVAVGAPEADVRPGRLWVVDDRLRSGATAADSDPYTGAPFMLFRLEVSTEHDNYRGFTTIERHMKDAETSLFGEKMDEATTHLRAACLEAWQSPDLTSADRHRLIDALRQRFAEAKKLNPVSFAATVEETTMEDRVRAAGSPRAALERPALDLSTMLG
jgi:hypothetical protein